MKGNHFLSALIALASLSTQALAQVEGYRSQISRDFRYEQTNKSPGFEILNRSIQNHTLASSLTSNAGEINRTVESLMESLFYSVMDQSANLRLADTLEGKANYDREVQATGIGTYVVYDRFRIGPEILKGLGKLKGLPLTFTNQNKLFLTNVTYRSDAQRKANSQTRSGFREWANNWFGLLPYLTRILPPSFNPEELYDPISYLGTPFLFPKDYKEALAMPLGTVRSYGLSGSAGTSIDVAGRFAKDTQESLALGDLTLGIPLGGFLEGEHQISILHTREEKVWIAVSEIRQIGTIAKLSLAQKYKIFQKLMSWWTGSLATIAPIDFELERSKILQKDEVYSFDLSKVEAREALNKALQGNFELAKALSRMPAQADESGVHFLFRRLSDRGEDSSRQARSFFVMQSQRSNRINDGENTLLDPKGQLITLEAEHVSQDRNWNVLTGAETVDVSFRFGLPVYKKNRDNQTFYRLIDDNEPNYLIANMRIIDRFHDAEDFRRSINLLRNFSYLPLSEIPDIPLYAKDVEQKLMKQQAFLNPMESTFKREVSPTHLGRFEAFTHVYIAQSTLEKIGNIDPSVFWRMYAKAHGLDETFWTREAEARGLAYYGHWLGSYVLLPFRFFNFDTGYSDFVKEGQRLLTALQTISRAKEPLELVRAYRQLMDTRHPVELLNTLNALSPSLTPVVVGISSSSDSNKNDSEDMKKAKEDFAKLNNKRIQSQTVLPQLKRNQSAEEKLAAFTPGGYRDEARTPQIRKLSLAVAFYPPDRNPRLKATLDVTGVGEDFDRMQLYLRVEENGPLTLGRFILDEEVKNIQWIASKEDEGGIKHTYELDLNGPKGLSEASYFDKAFAAKGAFDLFLSVSNQTDNWSQEQKMSFDIQNGLLRAL